MKDQPGSGHTVRNAMHKNKQEKLKEKQIVNSHVIRSRVMLVDKHRQKNWLTRSIMRAKISKKNQEKLKFSPLLFLTFTSMNKIS